MKKLMILCALMSSLFLGSCSDDADEITNNKIELDNRFKARKAGMNGEGSGGGPANPFSSKRAHYTLQDSY